MNKFKKKICGITGSKGVLGSEIIKSKKFKFIKFNGDITKKKEVNEWVKSNSFDLMIHLAAIVPVKKVIQEYNKAKKVNYCGTKNLINSIIKYETGLKWFFFASSSHVYNFNKSKIKETKKTAPISKYGRTKVMAENYIINKMKNKKNINFCIGRIFSFFSKRQSEDYLVPSLKNRILNSNNKLIILKNLNQYRDFIRVEKIIKIIFFLYSKNYSGTINIASGKKTFLKTVAKKINKNKKKIKFVDRKISYSLLGNIDKLKKLGFNENNLSPFN